VVDEVIPPALAPITVDPAAVVVARPAPLGPFAMVATLAADELQWVLNVTSCVVASVNVPTALNCCVLPAVTEGFAGVIAIELSVPFATVKVVVPVTPAVVAEMVTVPSFFPLANPEARIEAIFGLDDFQLRPLRFVAVLPSLNVPVAVNFSRVFC